MRGVASELFAVAAMAGGSYALIRWMAWTLDNVDEAIDDTFGDVPAVPLEALALQINEEGE